MAKVKRVKAKALFEGALPDRIPAIDKQCDRLLEARLEKGKANLREKEIQVKLIELFHAAKITTYRHEESGKVFKVEAPEAIKYKAAPKAEAASEDDDDTGEDETETVQS